MLVYQRVCYMFFLRKCWLSVVGFPFKQPEATARTTPRLCDQTNKCNREFTNKMQMSSLMQSQATSTIINQHQPTCFFVLLLSSINQCPHRFNGFWVSSAFCKAGLFFLRGGRTEFRRGGLENQVSRKLKKHQTTRPYTYILYHIMYIFYICYILYIYFIYYICYILYTISYIYIIIIVIIIIIIYIYYIYIYIFILYIYICIGLLYLTSFFPEARYAPGILLAHVWPLRALRPELCADRAVPGALRGCLGGQDGFVPSSGAMGKISGFTVDLFMVGKYMKIWDFDRIYLIFGGFSDICLIFDLYFQPETI
jgi:hypothetical protein